MFLIFIVQRAADAFTPILRRCHFSSVVDPELLPGSGSGIIVLDPAKHERADK